MINRRWRGVKAERRWAAVFFFGVLIREKKSRREKNGYREKHFPGQIVASSDTQGGAYVPHWETVMSSDPRPHIILLPPRSVDP